jgi:hypothetical protein
MKLTDLIIIIVGAGLVVNSLNNLNLRGLINAIVITLCVCLIVWVNNHKTETKITRTENKTRKIKRKYQRKSSKKGGDKK